MARRNKRKASPPKVGVEMHLVSMEINRKDRDAIARIVGKFGYLMSLHDNGPEADSGPLQALAFIHPENLVGFLNGLSLFEATIIAFGYLEICINDPEALLHIPADGVKAYKKIKNGIPTGEYVAEFRDHPIEK